MSRHLTNVEVINQIVVSLLLDGNAYMATARDATGRVLFVDILDPTLITPKIETSEDGSQRLTYTSTQAPEIVYSGRDITMFRNLLKPGQIKGVSPITAAREMLSLGIAQQSYASSMYGNGALPGGLVEVQGQLSETGVAQLKEGWNDLHQGARNGHRLAVLTEGAKFSQVALNPADAKWIEGSQATVRDIARLFGLPPFLLADSSGSTSWGSGIAEMNLAMQVYSLRPIVRRLEATFNGVLRSMGIEVAYFNIDLNRMSRHHPDRWSDYSTAIHSGILSINEARAWEGLSPVEDGDKHFMPLNLSPIDEPRP
jgi:HK97 family phage portal protein